MISLGLIGYPLSHSLSPRLHASALKAAGLEGNYQLYPVAPEDKSGLARLAERMRLGELNGLNVTIPHKQSVMEFLDEMSPSARVIGAVNTLIWKNNRLVGENTDAPGFLSDLHRSVPAGFLAKKAIVLGSGGAARAVVYGLLHEGWDVSLAVRKADIDQASQLILSMEPIREDHSITSVLLEATNLKPCLDEVDLIVNTTPLGMFPEIENSPWPKGLLFPSSPVIYDLVYNPRETAFLSQTRRAGLRVFSGIGMLVEQAALSFEIWTGIRPPRDVLFSEVEAE